LRGGWGYTYTELNIKDPPMHESKRANILLREERAKKYFEREMLPPPSLSMVSLCLSHTHTQKETFHLPSICKILDSKTLIESKFCRQEIRETCMEQ